MMASVVMAVAAVAAVAAVVAAVAGAEGMKATVQAAAETAMAMEVTMALGRASTERQRAEATAGMRCSAVA